MPDLLTLPTVEPDYRTHRRPAAASCAAASAWLLLHDPRAWAGEACVYRWCVANALLARREMFDARELTS